jgi:hypothetical protein
VSVIAGGLRVLGIPVIGETTPEKPKRQEDETLREIETIVNAIFAKNWREKKAALLELLAKVSDSNP